MFLFSVPIRTTNARDLDSYDFSCILRPVSRQEFDRVLGHRVETIEKGIVMAKPT